ncbi:MAG: FAD:protein FMN transferase [Clostridia bacterium]|nr:FAD:protein FMN transferase [Clostridia bacterium]
MKRIISLFLLILTVLSVSSCADKYSLREKNIYAMDTVITLRLYGTSDEVNAVAEKCEKKIKSIEDIISRTVDGSECSAFNGETDALYYPDAAFYDTLCKALEIAELTDGAYDPTVAALTDLWRINDPAASGIPSEAEIEEALSHVGYEKLTAEENKISKSDIKTKIDLGSIGKGYSCGKVIEYLSATELAYGLVSFGGNVAVFGLKPGGESFNVALRDPFLQSGTVGNITLDKGYVSVSGSYERSREVDGKVYHHIFDTSDGYPVSNGLVSVAVISENGMEADALSTALFVLGLEQGYDLYLSEKYDFEAIFITEDKEIYLTDGISEKFVLTAEDYVIKNFEG